MMCMMSSWSLLFGRLSSTEWRTPYRYWKDRGHNVERVCRWVDSSAFTRNRPAAATFRNQHEATTTLMNC